MIPLMASRPDSGSVAGSIAALAVLAVWGLGRLTQMGETPPVVEPAPPEDAQEVISPPSPATPLTPQDFRNSWEKDSRWDAAWEAGEAGKARLEELFEWHQSEGGDPFYFRAETKLARGQLETCLDLFDALATDFASNSTATAEIKRAKSRFSRALAGTRSKGGS